ncbi:MAG: MarR family transcriptional regulator [Vicinamibacterales bacterium]
MTDDRLALDDVTMPALLRHARAAYGLAMRRALASAGYDDIPSSGLYVIGGLARERARRPLGRLIADLRISKQAAGQLVDTLVVRGYLTREPDPQDRRRFTVGLTDRGRAAARTLTAARVAVDADLAARVGPRTIASARRTLAALIDIAADTTN